jgi:penicillin amidase
VNGAAGNTRCRQRLGRRIALILALSAGVALAAAWLGATLRQRSALRAAFPQANGRLPVVSLEAPVVVHRDARGIPHVRAESERDGFFALGFVHAQDRLAQMLWLERLARGRTAEVIGSDGLEWDRVARVIGFGDLADAQLGRLASHTRRALDAYAAGINARIERIEGGKVGAPAVVRALDIPLETWEPADSLAVFKAYAWGLGASVEASLVFQELVEELGAEGARPFVPRRDLEPPPAPRATVRAGGAGPDRGAFSSDPLRRALGLHGPSMGSSAWVIGAAHTGSGHPILAADSHLAPTVPAHLHFAHVSAGDLDVAGTTLPGVPVFWTGRNPHLAWASVHARAVVSDLFVETLDPGDPSRHYDGSRWRALPERIERLRVRGGAVEELRVAHTRHGPLLPARGDGDPLSVAWTGARIDGPSGIGSLLDVMRAEDAGALVDALRPHHEPVLAVAFADAAGVAGMQVAGWIPRRALTPGLLPLPGRARWYDWVDPVSFEALPRARLSDGTGWIVVADAPLPAVAGQEPIEWLWRSGERAARIEQLLQAAVEAGPVDVRSMSALQADVASLRAPALIGHALALLDAESQNPLSPEARELVAILRAWDGHSGPDSTGAVIYHEFVARLTEALLEPRLGGALLQRYLALPRADPERIVFEAVRSAALDAEPDHWEDRAAVARSVRESLHQAWLRLTFGLGANRGRWTWGRLHELRFEPFGGLGKWLGKRAPIGPYPYGGSRGTVSAAAYDPSEPFAVRVASTARFAVDSGSLDQALTALAPGQSEHREHPNYRDGIPDWLAGRSSLLATGRLLVEEASLARLVLEPVR